VAAEGWKEKEMESYCLMSTEFQLCNMKKVLEMEDGMVAQQRECTECHSTVT